MRVGLHYVVLNLAASALFLIGVSLLYAKTGTLNLADLALRVPKVEGPDAAVVQAAAWLLLVVFGFKAALLPLSLWLPATYAAARAPVAALFAIMTKVGVYAIWRVHGVVFGAEAGASAYTVEPLLLPLALGTSVLGVLGALAAHTLERLVAWLTVASVGTVLVASGAVQPGGLVGRRCTTWPTARWSSPGCSCWPNWWPRSAATPPTGWCRPRRWPSPRCWACCCCWPRPRPQACRRCPASSAS